MKLVTAAEMRELDARTIEEVGVPGEVLMERAGVGIADRILRLASRSPFESPRAHVIAGRGNNGGDGYVVARVLFEAGWDVEVWLAGMMDGIRGDALTHLQGMLEAGVELQELTAESEWEDAMEDPLECDIVVDALLGTGVTGRAQGAIGAAIRYVNTAARGATVVAVDLPSGLNADTGEAPGDVVRADVTLAMAQPKRGFVEPLALPFLGSVDVVDIGIPEAYLESLSDDGDVVGVSDVRRVLTDRAVDSHKGTYGHAWIIGGAPGFSGAVGLAAEGAARAGAGLVSALMPESIAGITAAGIREVMVHGGLTTASGSLSVGGLEVWGDRVSQFQAILIGPGMTAVPDTRACLEWVLEHAACPVVIDADGLNVLAEDLSILEGLRVPVVVTPHPGEMARLIGEGTEWVQDGRRECAVSFAQKYGVYVALKGAGTVIASPDGVRSVNLTGNPGMASGGMGDVLGGMITGFLAQGVDVLDAVRVAVFLHGMAGDLAASSLSQRGLLAGDVLDEFPSAMRECGLR